ncbi:MAG: hypothetical protein ACRCZF_20960, partial [Gemmataceae bacterium]
RFPNWDGRMPDTTVEERNLRRAEARKDHAQEKARLCQKWLAQLPKQIDETYSGPSRRLLNFLEADVARQLAVLEQQAEALERYAQVRIDYAPAPSSENR